MRNTLRAENIIQKAEDRRRWHEIVAVLSFSDYKRVLSYQLGEHTRKRLYI